MNTITPADIRQGDAFRGVSQQVDWTALADPITYGLQSGGTAIRLEVQYADGGIDYRYWNTDTEARFTVTETDTGRTLSPVI